MKMAVKRVVNTDFWNDSKVMDLFSPEDKLFMLYLLTNPHTTQLGIYAINPKHMSFELGYTSEVIHVLLDRFEKKLRHYQIFISNKRNSNQEFSKAQHCQRWKTRRRLPKERNCTSQR